MSNDYTKKGIIILTRGPSGCGKSYLANQILNQFPNGIICCADDYLYDENKVYAWSGDKLGYAHKRCEDKFYQGLLEKISPIIVANTNIKWRDIKPYAELATLYDYEIYVAEPNTAWAKDAYGCLIRNGGRAPLHAIQRALKRYQPNEHIIEQGRYNGIEIRIWERAE
jgi:predicted kinase